MSGELLHVGNSDIFSNFHSLGYSLLVVDNSDIFSNVHSLGYSLLVVVLWMTIQ
jgi:hypothetical protein